MKINEYLQKFEQSHFPMKKTIIQGLVSFLVGFLFWIGASATNATLSVGLSFAWSIPIYFLLGLVFRLILKYPVKTSLWSLAPFLINGFIAIFGNPSLIPFDIPIGVIVWGLSFFWGFYFVNFPLKKQLMGSLAFAITALLFLYIIIPHADFNSNSYQLSKPFPWSELKGVNVADWQAAKHQGKVLYIDFWSTTCGQCIDMFPDVQATYDKYRDHPCFEMLVLGSKKYDTFEKLSDSRWHKPYSFPKYYDETGAFTDSLGVRYLPRTFLVSAEGNVVFSHIGYLPDDARVHKSRMEKEIEALLRECETQ